MHLTLRQRRMGTNFNFFRPHSGVDSGQWDWGIKADRS